MTEPRDKPREHRRCSIWLRGFDYALNGAYFVTLRTRNRERLFGEIIGGTMRLNDAGQMIETWWHRLPDRFPNIETDAFIVIPNHIHAIIVIKNPNYAVETQNFASLQKTE